jgi:hypothetical protein
MYSEMLATFSVAFVDAQVGRGSQQQLKKTAVAHSCKQHPSDFAKRTIINFEVENERKKRSRENPPDSNNNVCKAPNVRSLCK